MYQYDKCAKYGEEIGFTAGVRLWERDTYNWFHVYAGDCKRADSR